MAANLVFGTAPMKLVGHKCVLAGDLIIRSSLSMAITDTLILLIVLHEKEK